MEQYGRQLLVDVSVILSKDARTGIQRVVRALLLQLLQHPPDGYQVRPVFATRTHGYRYAPAGFGLPANDNSGATEVTNLRVQPGDIFLGLDLAAHILPRHCRQLTQWKRTGVGIHVLVYDLLPVLHPHWFNAKTAKNFRSWLKTVAMLADSMICISQTVKGELRSWLQQQYGLTTDSLPIGTIPLGADIQSSAPNSGLPENAEQFLHSFSGKPMILMVGTLEPRKGHSQVLAAFEKLWATGKKASLVIVGKPGWHMEALQESLLAHPYKNIYLHWLDNASDEFLELLYAASTGVIVASKAEGFGLPLIEAMYHGKPVLARDIPVFHEIGGNITTYFSDTSELTAQIAAWLTKLAKGCAPQIAPRMTWQDSANALLDHLAIGQNRPVQADVSACPCATREAIT